MARKLEVEIVGDARSLHKALDESGRRSSKFGGVLSSLKTGAIGAGVALAGGLAVGLEKSIHAAIEAETVNARLNVAFRNAGLSAKKYADEVDHLESSGRRLGFTDEQTKNSLGSLITATGSMAQATRSLGIAQDLARFKSVGLEQATKALTMAHAGSTRALKQLGIDVPKVTDAVDKLKASTKDHTGAIYANELAQAKLQDKSATYQNVLEATTKAVHGQAAAYSQTAAGAMEQFHAQIAHIEVAIGEKLLPVMMQAIQWITAHWPEITKTVQDSWAQIRPTLNALIELVKAVVQSIRDNWGTIGPIVKDVAGIIKAQIAIITGVIKVLTDLLRGDWSAAWNDAKGVVAAFGREIVAYIDTAKRLVFVALRGIADGLAALAGAFVAAAKALGVAIVRGIVSGLEALPGALLDALQGAVDYAFGHVHGPHKVLGIPTGPSLKSILGFAGGTKSAPGGLALVGEKGPELVNLPGGSSVIPNSALGGNQTIQLILDGSVLAEVLIDPLRNQARLIQRRTGRPAFS